MKLLNQLCPSAVKRQGLSNLLCNFSFKKKSVPVTKNRRDMVENNLVPVGEAFCKHSIKGMYSKHDESLRTLQSPPFFCHNLHQSTLTLLHIRDRSKSIGRGGSGPEHLEMWLIKNA